MKQYISRGKTLLIFLLLAFSVVQTGRLWFDNLSNRNFFYSFFARLGQTVSTGQGLTLASPYRIITDFGNRRYQIQYTGLRDSDQKKDGDKALASVLTKGDFVAAYHLNELQLLNNRAYIYDYAVPVPASAFANTYGQKGGLLTSRAQEISRVFIVPPRAAEERLHVYFVNDGTQTVYEYWLPASSYAESVNTHFQNLQSQAGLVYSSSAQQGLNILEGDQFIPAWMQGAYPYRSLLVINPYVETERLLDEIGKKVEVFFDNPAAIWPDRPDPNGPYTYSDENTVVKYYPTDVLEYYNYQMSSEPTTDINQAFQTAAAFLQRDTAISNEYYLADMRSQAGQYIFSFDFMAENMPVLLPSSTQEDLQMDHAMEVTVENGQVVKYRKLVYQYQVNPTSTTYATATFLNALDSLIRGTPGEEKPQSIQQVRLAYRFDAVKPVGYYWFFQWGGQTYTKAAQ